MLGNTLHLNGKSGLIGQKALVKTLKYVENSTHIGVISSLETTISEEGIMKHVEYLPAITFDSGVSYGYFGGSLMRLSSETGLDTPNYHYALDSGVSYGYFGESLMRLSSENGLDTPDYHHAFDSGVSFGDSGESLMRLSSESGLDTPDRFCVPKDQK